jgi:hypothetical protein
MIVQSSDQETVKKEPAEYLGKSQKGLILELIGEYMIQGWLLSAV